MVDGDETVNGYTAQWLKARLAASTAPWKVVVAHYPRWCSCKAHPDYITRRWPFKAWGADLIICGHDHVYERLWIPDSGGLVAIVCGTCNPMFWTEVHPFQIWEAMANVYTVFGYGTAPQVPGTCRFRATAHSLTSEYVDTGLNVIDTVTLTK